MDLSDLRLSKPDCVYGYIYHTVFRHPVSGVHYHYIGQKTGSSVCKRYYGSGYRIRSFVQKYGRAGTTSVRVVRWCTSRDSLNESEVHFVAEARRLWGGLCINLQEGGKGGKHSERTKRKMRKPKDPESVRKSAESRKGQKRSIVSRERMAKAHLGKKRGPDPVVTCPHCGKSGGSRAMNVWHFDRCVVHTGQPRVSPIKGRTLGSYGTGECPHCGVKGFIRVLKRNHFDRCGFSSLIV